MKPQMFQNTPGSSALQELTNVVHGLMDVWQQTARASSSSVLLSKSDFWVVIFFLSNWKGRELLDTAAFMTLWWRAVFSWLWRLSFLGMSVFRHTLQKGLSGSLVSVYTQAKLFSHDKRYLRLNLYDLDDLPLGILTRTSD